MSGMNCKSQTPCSILAPRQAYAAAFINGMHLQLADGWNKQTDENRAHGRRLLAREAWDFADAMIAEESNNVVSGGAGAPYTPRAGSVSDSGGKA